MRGARILAASLEDADVEYAFGLAGSTNLGILDEIAQSDVEFVGTRHEQVAAGMATGYALATRRPTAAVSHVGPGAANLVIGMASAYREHVPVVAITGNEPSYNIGRNVKHECDVMAVFERITKHSVRMERDHPHEQVRDALARSVTGMPGPVHVDVPHDLENEELPDPDDLVRKRTQRTDHRASVSRARPPADAVEATLNLLEDAEQPLLLAGSEVRWFDAAGELGRFVEDVEVPVAAAHNARGALSEDHPLSLGLAGWIGLGPTNDYLREADLVLAVGASFSDYTTSDWRTVDPSSGLVHITMRERELDRHYVADVNALADPASTLADLRTAAAERGFDRSFADAAAPAREAYVESRRQVFDPDEPRGGDGVDPGPVLLAIDRLAGTYAFVTGGGIHAKFARHLPVRDLNGRFGTLNFSGMSQGLPVAMGAQLALDRQVFAFEGDGGFAMVMQDLETAVREEIPVKVLVLNNDAYMSQTVRQEREYGGRYTGTTYGNPDFAAFAENVGAFGESVTNDAQVPDAVERFVEAEGPALLDVHVDPWIGTDLLS